MPKRRTLLNSFYLFVVVSLLIAPGQAQAQCCDYTVAMQDGYGDGWNGGNVDVRVNNVLVGTFAAQGHHSTATFNICDGDALQLVYHAGYYEEENTYQVFGPAGNVVFADGPSPTAGVVFNGTGDCAATVFPGSVPCAALPIDTADCITVDNTGIAGSGISAGCANYQGADLWYTMPVPFSGNVVVSTSALGGLTDTGISLWTGSSCFDLQEWTCDDDGGDGYFSQAAAYDLPPGGMLYIQVFGYGGAQGAFQLCVQDLGTVTLDSTELPLVKINTLGQTIPDEPKIDALMRIAYNGPGLTTLVSDPPNVYDGHVGIEVRGATSAGYPQQPYGFETRTDLGQSNDVPLLGMPPESDWVLLSNYNDRSLLRNQIAFHLAQGMGQYAPRSFLSEVLLDSAYRGIYLLGEKIKRDQGRVDIAKLDPDENSGDNLTGGYILSQNLWNNDDSFESNYSPIDHPGFDVHFVYEYPKPDVITAEQKTYIAAYVDSLETALYSPQFADPVIGYRKFLDVPSFISYFLVNEVARNADGFKKSRYFHKDKYSNGGKLKAGPVWDFDWAWKNIYGCFTSDATDGSGWVHEVNDCDPDNHSCGWYIRMLQDTAFANELRCTYETYRTTILDTTQIFSFIDSVAARVDIAQARHFQKWPILGISGPAPEVNEVATTYAGEIDTLKAWITTRLAWLDVNMPGECSGQPNGMSTSPAVANLRIFPNPSAGRFHVEGSASAEGPRIIVLRDVAWRVVQEIPLSNGPFSREIELRESGVYFFTLECNGRMLQQEKLVVY